MGLCGSICSSTAATRASWSYASARVEMQAGERFLLQSAGAGGYGDPKQRDPAAVARDVAEGHVTEEAAKKDYGSA